MTEGLFGRWCFHHGVVFIFSHGLDFKPSFIARSTFIFYREIKWTTRLEIARPTVDVLTKQRNWTSLTTGLKHFGLKLSWLCVQTSRSGFSRLFGKLNKFKAVITFPDSEILQSHFMVFLSSMETKLLGKYHIVWIRPLGLYHGVSRSSR